MYKRYTGHIYRYSPYETAYDCGNCSGGMCEVCFEEYSVDGDTWTTDLEAVKAEENALQDDICILLGLPSGDEVPLWYLHEHELYLSDYGDLMYHFERYGYETREIVCNPEAKCYMQYYCALLEEWRLWAKCEVINKDITCPRGCKNPNCYDQY